MTLTTVAPVVLFSAAVPLQGGNRPERTPPTVFGNVFFARRDFTRIDCIRPPLIWQDARVAWWYRQNICLYASTPLFFGTLTASVTRRVARGPTTSN